jgi:cytochrome c oxidase cbb3-type subunit 1
MTLAVIDTCADLPNKTPKPWNLRMSTAISPTAYNYKVVRQFAIMTVVWGILGMGLGVFIASQLVWPELTWTCHGRASAACARCTPTW